MGHGPIFLSDSKSRDPEAGPLYSYQDAAKRQTLNYSSENKPSLIKALVKSALKLALVILAFVLLAELHELHRSKACLLEHSRPARC